MFRTCKESQLRLFLTEPADHGNCAKARIKSWVTSQPLVNWSSNRLMKPQETATSWKPWAEKARLSTSHLHVLQHDFADSRLLKELIYRCHTTGTSLSHFVCPSLTGHTLSKPVRKQLCKVLVSRARKGEGTEVSSWVINTCSTYFLPYILMFKAVF